MQRSCPPLARRPGSLTAVICLLVAVISRMSQADIHWDQQSGTRAFAIGSMYFSQFPDDSSFVSDDFFVDAPFWKITKVTLYGRDNGDVSTNEGVKLAFLTSPAHDSGAPTYDGLYTMSGFNNRNRDLIFDFSTPVKLPYGTNWLSGWVIRPQIDILVGGFWLWIGQTPPTLGEAYRHEPAR